MKNLKKGSYVHNGYSRLQILGTSPYKEYEYVVKICPQHGDCIGAWRMSGRTFHVSYKVALGFKECK